MTPRRILSALLGSAALAAMAGAAAAEYRLTILHINDLHSRIEEISRFDGACSAADSAEGKCFGGVARVKAYIDQRRDALAAAGANYLVLDAGDQFQGSLFYSTYKGAAELEFMNEMGFDAMAVGNHEFDDGPEVLSDFIRGAGFPVISGNTDVSAEPLLAGRLPGHVVVDVGGHKIGIISVLATDTDETSSPGPNVKFLDEIDYLIGEVAILEATGVDKIIALTHVGFKRDLEIAAAVPGIDVIVGGHSHTYLSASDPAREGAYPTWVSGPFGALVPVVQAYAYSKYVGELTVEFDDRGNIVFAEGDTKLLDASVAPDPAIAARVTELAGPIEDLKNTVVAETAAPIDGDRSSCRARECEMGVLVAEAMLDKTAAQGVTIAIQNGGGVRASIDAGPVTMGEVLTVLPFQNTIATMRLSGANIVAALENGVSKVEEAAGRFPQPAGLRYSFDPALPAGARITGVEVIAGGGWAPIDPDAIYGVVTNNYMRQGGDGYASFRDGAIDPYDYGPNLEEAVAAYLAANSPYTPALRGNVVIGASLSGAAAPASAAPAADAGMSYVVQPGDTLWAIARAKLGDATLYTKIMEANGLSEGAVLAIGQELVLPK